MGPLLVSETSSLIYGPILPTCQINHSVHLHRPLRTGLDWPTRNPFLFKSTRRYSGAVAL